MIIMNFTFCILSEYTLEDVVEGEDDKPEMIKRAPFRSRRLRIRLPSYRRGRLVRRQICKVVGVTSDGRKFLRILKRNVVL